ncbi:MAG: FAD-binding oxidoreductase [Acidimicrobiia bacterium]
MAMTGSVDLDALRGSMKGSVIDPDDPSYEDARKVWNADIDRRPAVIARCESPADVATAVSFATEHGLPVAVRGGAHSMPGSSVVDDGLVIDLSPLNQVTVDPAAKRVRIGGGALLADLDAATQAHGLAVPAGVVSHTGVGGLTLGGGMGWLTRLAGLSIDNLVSAEVVTADGRVLRADENEHPDLFWALRGGGGNFGVVTEFEFRLHEVGPIVHLAMLFWGLEDGPAALRLIRDVIPTLPPELGIIFGGMNAPPAPFVPEEHHHELGIALLLTGFGSAEAHAETVARIREALPPAFAFVDSLPYVALQQMLDEANAWGFHCYDKGNYVEDLSDEAIQVVMEHLPGKSSPLSLFLLYRLDGAYSAVGDDDTAFSGGRSPRYAVFILGVCPVPELLAGERAWVRSFWEALSPHTIGIGSYVNSMTEIEDDRMRASYGPAKYERLARIKREYDPGNVFRHNANIKPA